jgi:hypothetical protein
MFLLAGWGKNAQHVCNAGIHKCGNCKNWCVFEVVETSKKVTAFLVPIAKYSKQTFAVCPICDSGVELDASETREIIASLPTRPDSDSIEAIWGELLENLPEDFVAQLKASVDDGVEIMEGFDKIIQPSVERFSDRFSAEQIAYVSRNLLQYLFDDDRPA